MKRLISNPFKDTGQVTPANGSATTAAVSLPVLSIETKRISFPRFLPFPCRDQNICLIDQNCGRFLFSGFGCIEGEHIRLFIVSLCSAVHVIQKICPFLLQNEMQTYVLPVPSEQCDEPHAASFSHRNPLQNSPQSAAASVRSRRLRCCFRSCRR